MALNPIVFTEKVVRSFLRYQLTAYPFYDEGLHSQMRRLLSLDQTRQSPLLKGPYVRIGDRDVHEITTFFHGSVSTIYPEIEKPYDIRSPRFNSAESMNAGDERWERGGISI